MKRLLIFAVLLNLTACAAPVTITPTPRPASTDISTPSPTPSATITPAQTPSPTATSTAIPEDPALIPPLSECPTNHIIYKEYSSLDDPNKGYYVVCPDTGVKQKTALPEYAVFSPDGKTVAYIEDNVVTISDVASGTSKKLHNTFSEGDILIPSWSPDGQYIGYTEYAAWVEGEELKSFFKVVHVETGIVSDVFENRYLAYGVWSPVGNTIMYFNINLPPNLFLADIDCAAETHLCTAGKTTQLQDAGAVERPAWSPDATKIVALCYQDGVKSLCLLDLNGVILQQFDLGLDLDSGYLGIGSPIWSPDGTYIAFSAKLIGNLPDIYLLSLETLEVRNLSGNPLAVNVVPIWIPD